MTLPPPHDKITSSINHFQGPDFLDMHDINDIGDFYPCLSLNVFSDIVVIIYDSRRH